MRAQNDNVAHDWGKEVRLWVAIAIPICITNIFRTTQVLTDVSILGHFNGTEPASGGLSASGAQHSTQFLAASGYVGVFSTLVNVAVIQGIAATISVIGTNAYGAGNIRLLGYTLLLGLSMCSVASLFICIATYFAGDAMYWLIGFDASMRQLVTDYARISIIGIFPYHWSNCIGQWLLAQKRVFPQLATYGVVAAANVGLNFLFIYGAGQWPGFGFVGSALATAVARWVGFFMLLLLCICLPTPQQRVGKELGPSEMSDPSGNVQPLLPGGNDNDRGRPTEMDVDKLRFRCDCTAAHTRARICRYLTQAVPMALVGLLEDGQLQLMTIMAGWLGTTAVATHNGIFQVFWFLSSMMWAVTTATKVRIAAYLGAGDAKGGRFALKISSFIAFPTALAVSLLIVLLRGDVGKVFSRDPAVWAKAEQIALLIGVSYFALAVFYMSVATLSAQGRPHLIAIAFVIGAWLVCTPLAFVFKYASVGPLLGGLFGIWCAISIGYGVTTILGAIFTARSDWGALARQAQERAEATASVSASAVTVAEQQAAGEAAGSPEA